MSAVRDAQATAAPAAVAVSSLGADLELAHTKPEPAEFAEDAIELDAERLAVYGLALELHAFESHVIEGILCR